MPPLITTTRAIERKRQRRIQARFDRLERGHRADKLAALLSEGERNFLRSSHVSVRLDNDVGLEFSSADRDSGVMIRLDPRSREGGPVVLGGSGRGPSRFSWQRRKSISVMMADIRAALRMKGFVRQANALDPADVWQRLLQTLRVAYGIDWEEVASPLRRVREVVNEAWVITDDGIRSASNDLGIGRREIWDDALVAVVRNEADKRRQGESFDEAVKWAKELFYIERPK